MARRYHARPIRAALATRNTRVSEDDLRYAARFLAARAVDQALVALAPGGAPAVGGARLTT